ncbi:hypothetical protein IQ266_01280 [filamentous cyanobacterium LEGE 11480]|uniref:Uncharacterized protein n=2 Tax=Romeriopsis TaxID=2992131 RepID=A0A928Z2H2_9CYAN|nr:hypothetical protein [Romeriopsis navalis LEGE 11480]
MFVMLAVAYVAFGDAFLPGKAGYYSTYSRATMNNMLVNMFPSWQSKTNPYQRTEKAIEQEENGK